MTMTRADVESVLRAHIRAHQVPRNLVVSTEDWVFLAPFFYTDEFAQDSKSTYLMFGPTHIRPVYHAPTEVDVSERSIFTP